MSDDKYVPLPPQVIEAMPNAEAVKRHLTAAIEERYAELVKARGDVTRQEDVYAGVRTVTSWHEQARDLKAVFEGARKQTAELLEDELVAVSGEQSGVPNLKTLTVPDAEGDIVLTAGTTNVYHIDVESLISAATALHLSDSRAESIVDIVNGDHETIGPDQLDDVLAELCASVTLSVLDCGKFEPQVTKVNAYADAIARGGDDALSAVVRSAVRKTVKTTGVTAKRKAN